MLGIIIGVAAVIILVTLGGGATSRYRADFPALGSNLMMVSRANVWGGPGLGRLALNSADAEALAREIPPCARWPHRQQSYDGHLRKRENGSSSDGHHEQYFAWINRRIGKAAAFTRPRPDGALRVRHWRTVRTNCLAASIDW